MKTVNISDERKRLVSDNPDFNSYFEMVARLLNISVDSIVKIEGIKVTTIYENYLSPIGKVLQISLPDGKKVIAQEVNGNFEFLTNAESY